MPAIGRVRIVRETYAEVYFGRNLDRCRVREKSVPKRMVKRACAPLLTMGL